MEKYVFVKVVQPSAVPYLKRVLQDFGYHEMMKFKSGEKYHVFKVYFEAKTYVQLAYLPIEHMNDYLSAGDFVDLFC